MLFMFPQYDSLTFIPGTKDMIEATQFTVIWFTWVLYMYMGAIGITQHPGDQRLNIDWGVCVPRGIKYHLVCEPILTCGCV